MEAEFPEAVAAQTVGILPGRGPSVGGRVDHLLMLKECQPVARRALPLLPNAEREESVQAKHP